MTESSSSDRKPLLFISFFIFFLFCLLIMQFYKVQIVEGNKWLKKGLLQHQKVVIEPAMRGRFFSNSSIQPHHVGGPVLFVTDVPKHHLFIDPLKIPENKKELMKNELLCLLNLDGKKDEFLSVEFNRKKRKRRLVKWLDQEKKEEVLSWWRDFYKTHKLIRNCLFFEQDFKRVYPFGSLLGQVLHTVQDERDPKTNQAIPTGGLELYFNEILKGKEGKRIVLRSPKNDLNQGKVLQSPENGADIYLTINHYIQAITEEELARGVKFANAKGGWAIIMDPYTGDILSIAQYPFFDPLSFKQHFNEKSYQEHFRIRAITDAFEPGSIFKPITMGVCMVANEVMQGQKRLPLFCPEEKLYTRKGIFPGRSKPLKDGRVHNYLNMYHGIQKSSNIYMASVVKRVIDEFGDNWYRQALLQLFGFGKKTNIELPAESIGLLPEIGKIHPNGRLEWSKSTPYSLAIGHNILVNSMQMIKSFAIIANGGMDVQPTLVKKVIKQKEGENYVLYDNFSKKAKERILSKPICDELIKAMKYVTKLGGTARSADIMGYSEAGKSGTSEKIINGKYSKKKYFASFIGMAPANNPRFVILVVIDEPEVKFVQNVGKLHHGGVSAAPVFKEIGSRCLTYLGVPPDDPYGYPYGDPRRDFKKADWFLQVQKLKDQYIRWNNGK
jgi:cell division protein FtsI (penicillin-binding protein 3)